MVSDLYIYSIVLYSIFIITLFYVRNPHMDENSVVADAVLIPKEKKAVPASKDLQSKCKIKANRWMWTEMQYLVCGTSVTLLYVNCNILSIAT